VHDVAALPMPRAVNSRGSVQAMTA